MSHDCSDAVLKALAAQPPATALTLPAACYVQPQFAALERQAVLARGWQLVARDAQLSATGDHVVSEIAGVPLLIVRGDDGVLRALHNVCRHRAGPLATCDGQGAQQLQCRYHGWRYAVDGQLLGAPDMGRAQDFDLGTVRLPQAHVVEWQGQIFAALNERAPFAEQVEGIDARLGAVRLADYEFDRRVSYEVNCNWKVYVDNYLEGYHVPRVHPGLASLLDAPRYTTSTARWHSLQASPLAGSGPYAAGEALYFWAVSSSECNVE